MGAFGPYFYAVRRAFHNEIDNARLVRVYGKPNEHRPEWHGSAEPVDVTTKPIMGNPDPGRVGTSYVERSNLSMRTSPRRFARLGLGFSKKFENLAATIALYVAWHNFCRVHQTLRTTPAVAAGIASRVWRIKDLLTC